MTSRRVVAVLHGVARRDREAFVAEVDALAHALAIDAEVIPLFWGDVPHPAGRVEEVLPYPSWSAHAAALDDPGDSPGLRSAVRDRDLEAILDSISSEWRRRSEASRRRLLSTVYNLVRSQYLRASAEFTGDLIYYHRHRQALWGHTWEQLIRRVPGVGLADRPLTVVAHSLGCTLAFEMAVAAQPRLHIDHLFTCATQSPFFHVTGCSPTEIDPTGAGGPVTLPPTIGAWTNFFVPLDPWAYLAAGVFTLHDGAIPDDVELRGGALTDRVVNHTSAHYWQHAQVIERLREELTGGMNGERR